VAKAAVVAVQARNQPAGSLTVNRFPAVTAELATTVLVGVEADPIFRMNAVPDVVQLSVIMASRVSCQACVPAAPEGKMTLEALGVVVIVGAPPVEMFLQVPGLPAVMQTQTAPSWVVTQSPISQLPVLGDPEAVCPTHRAVDVAPYSP